LAWIGLRKGSLSGGEKVDGVRGQWRLLGEKRRADRGRRVRRSLSGGAWIGCGRGRWKEVGEWRKLVGRWRGWNGKVGK
jgi:hypothetical protein